MQNVFFENGGFYTIVNGVLTPIQFRGFGGFGGIGRRGASGTKVNPLTNVLFVDKNTAVGTPDGSIANPYTTIQSAIDIIPTATNSAESKSVWNVVISPDTYDEALTIDITGKRVVLTSWGAWNLGEFNSGNWLPSGTLRDITIIGDTASIDNIRCGLSITTYNQVGQRYSTNQSYLNGCRISGAVIVKVSGGASLELDIQAEVFGNGGVAFGVNGDNGSPNPILQIYLYNGRWKGTFNGGTNSNFQHAENVRFGGLLTTPNYSLIKSCSFDNGGGMVVASATNAGLFPQGIIDTYFAAGSTFTGPPNSMRVNGNTNYWLLPAQNNIVISAGAKVIQDDLTL